MDNSASGIIEQHLTTLKILNQDPDNLKWMLTQNKQGVLLRLVRRNQPQLAHSWHSNPKPRPITANVVDHSDRDGAKLHFAEKQMKLTENKENEKPVLAARTTARRKGNPNMEKRIIKAKSPGKKLRDQRRLNQFKAKRRLLIVGLCRN